MQRRKYILKEYQIGASLDVNEIRKFIFVDIPDKINK